MTLRPHHGPRFRGREILLAHMDSVVACGEHERDAVVQDETAVRRGKDPAQNRCPLQQELIRCLFIAVLQKANAGRTQFAGKTLNGEAGP